MAGEKKAATRSLNSGVAGLKLNAGDKSEHDSDGTPGFNGGMLNSDAGSKVQRRFAASVASNVFFNGLGDDDALEVRIIVVVDQLGIVLSLLTSTHFYTFDSMHAHAYAFEV